VEVVWRLGAVFREPQRVGAARTSTTI